MQDDRAIYVGFWARVAAAVIDTLLLMLVLVPAMMLVFGADYFHLLMEDTLASLLDPLAPRHSNGPADDIVQLLVAALAIIPFWLYRKATPGKMLIGAEVVDAKSGHALTARQSVLRYLGYFVSIIPLFLGLIWVAFDPRKQGWHDKIAGSVVIRGPERR